VSDDTRDRDHFGFFAAFEELSEAGRGQIAAEVFTFLGSVGDWQTLGERAERGDPEATEKFGEIIGQVERIVHAWQVSERITRDQDRVRRILEARKERATATEIDPSEVATVEEMRQVTFG
jgi:hypothetical protein